MDINNSEAAEELLPCSEGIKTDWQILVKQYNQVGFLWLDLSPINPAGHWRVPAQVCWINIQDACKSTQEYINKWTNCKKAYKDKLKKSLSAPQQ